MGSRKDQLQHARSFSEDREKVIEAAELYLSGVSLVQLNEKYGFSSGSQKIREELLRLAWATMPEDTDFDEARSLNRILRKASKFNWVKARIGEERNTAIALLTKIGWHGQPENKGRTASKIIEDDKLFDALKLIASAFD